MEAISFSTQTYDLNGYLMLQHVDIGRSDLNSRSRRITRYATLDTGAYLDDAGYSDGDRTITVSMTGTETIFNSLVYLLENYGVMWVMLPDGAYTGAISNIDRNNGRIQITVLIQATA